MRKPYCFLIAGARNRMETVTRSYCQVILATWRESWIFVMHTVEVPQRGLGLHSAGLLLRAVTWLFADHQAFSGRPDVLSELGIVNRERPLGIKERGDLSRSQIRGSLPRFAGMRFLPCEDPADCDPTTRSYKGKLRSAK